LNIAAEYRKKDSSGRASLVPVGEDRRSGGERRGIGETWAVPWFRKKHERESDHGSTSMIAISASHISPLAALIAGILILVIPRILNYVVAMYLILIGLMGILGR
jgi:hypothetical protein